MPLEIPDLDPLDFQHMTAALRQQIPKYNELWNDFNYSDPGITLMEMLVWVTETLAYRTNRIPRDTYASFLNLLGGASHDEIEEKLKTVSPQDPDYREFLKYLLRMNQPPRQSAAEMRAKAVAFFRARYLAVTQEDFEVLAKDTNQVIGERAMRVGSATVETRNEIVIVYITPESTGNCYKLCDFKEKQSSMLEHRSTCQTKSSIDSTEENRKQEKELLNAVRAYLRPRTLLGTVVKIAVAVCTPITIKLKLLLEVSVNLRTESQNIKQRIVAWLDPIKGGADRRGWPYGHMPTQAEIVDLLLGITTVRRVIDVAVCVQPPDTAALQTDIIIPASEEAIEGFPQPQLDLTLVKQRTRGGS